jgi:hypothetical protein
MALPSQTLSFFVVSKAIFQTSYKTLQWRKVSSRCCKPAVPLLKRLSPTESKDNGTESPCFVEIVTFFVFFAPLFTEKVEKVGGFVVFSGDISIFRAKAGSPDRCPEVFFVAQAKRAWATA